MHIIAFVFALIAISIAADASRRVKKLEAQLKARGLLDDEKKI
jgi:hypothetical protein